MFRRLVVCLLPLLLLCGTTCSLAVSEGVQEPAAVERATAALQRAVDHYRDGKLNEAAGLLRGFLVSHAGSPLIDEAYLQLARIHERLAQPEQALDYLAQIRATALTTDGQLLKGRLLVQAGEASAALRQLLQVDPSLLSIPEQQQRLLSLGDAALSLEQPHRALYFYHRALLVEGAETPAEVLARVRSLMDLRYRAADLAEAAFMYADSPVGYLAMLEMGWRAKAAGHKETAREWASAVLAGPPGFLYRDEAMTLLTQLADPSRLQRAIGVLLPRSGRYAAFGKHVERGMELARDVYRPSVPVEFIYRDTAGDPEQSGRMFNELAFGERVMAIAGPLVGSAAEAAAGQASQTRVPLLTMSQREGLTEGSLYVFRNSLTSRLQVKTLVEHAMTVLGLSEFGLLYPQTRQGRLLAELFQAEVGRRGGQLVAVESYLQEQTDFRRQVRLLRGLDPDAPDEEEEPPRRDEAGNPIEAEEEPPPFQALFIPDYAERISLLAPQLEFYGLEGVQLLGTNGWNDPALISTAGKFVEGAVFTDGFFEHSPYPFVQEFVARYYNRHGEDPNILAAQGYDTAGILLTLLDRDDLHTREDLRRALSQLQNFPGVTGATRFDYQGDADKVLFLLQIQNGTVVQIN